MKSEISVQTNCKLHDIKGVTCMNEVASAKVSQGLWVHLSFFDICPPNALNLKILASKLIKFTKNLSSKSTVYTCLTSRFFSQDDEFTHLYTLIVKSDNTYEVRIDGEKVESGELEADWDFLPPKKIKDPEAKKPEDWDDKKKIDDPEDKKPEVNLMVLCVRFN